MHPEYEIAGSFAHLKLGRLPPKHDPRTLLFASYLDETIVLPEIPEEADWTLGVRQWPMFGNDRLGDCTIASAGHMIQAWTTAAGHPSTPSDKDILDAYWATGDHTDTGRYEIDVLNYWRHHGIGRDRISAYVAIDPRNLTHMQAAVYLFGGVYIGVSLPVSAQGQTVWDIVGDGDTGDSAPGSWGGHAVSVHAYKPGTFTCVTWGGLVTITEPFHRTYCDEAYAVLSRDWLDASKVSPAGFDVAALTRDLEALSG